MSARIYANIDIENTKLTPKVNFDGYKYPSCLFGVR